MEVTGYKYQTLAEANEAKDSLRAYYLDGRQPGNYVTTELVSVKQDTQGFYYFLGDYSPVLGSPTAFNITVKRIG